MWYRAVAVSPLLVAALVSACADTHVTGPAPDAGALVPRAAVLLTGSGVFLITPVALEFGEVQAGATSVPQLVTVTNVSSGPQTLSLAGGAPALPFGATQDCQGVTLAAGASCHLTYTFAPTAAGSVTETSAGTINGQEFSIGLHGTGVSPEILVTPTRLDFGDVAIGSAAEAQAVTVTNAGSAELVVSMAGGAPAAPFEASQNCQAVTLAPGASCQISYTFTPAAAGSFSASSAGTVNDQPFTVELSGRGSAPQLLITPTALDFGDVSVGQASAPQVARVTNAGTSAVTLALAGGAVGSPFNAIQSCQSQILAPGASCEITYTFTPAADFMFAAVSSGNINGQPFSVSLRGAGLAQGGSPSAQFVLTPFGLEFGNVPVGTTSAAQVVNVKNAGSSSVVVSMAGGAPFGPFSASQNCEGVTLAAGASCQIVYTFVPTEPGTHTGWSAGTINGQEFEVSLQGTGVAPAFLISPTGLAFGEVPAGSNSEPQFVNVTNVSAAAVTVSMAGGAPADPFGATQNCQGVTLAPGASCQITLTFAPSTVGDFTATSAGTVNDQPFSVTLGGEGVAPQFLITPVGLEFGGVALGAASPQQAVSVTNAGNAPVVVDMAGGAPGGPFSASQDCQGRTLAPAEACSLFYTFSPTTGGPAAAHSIGTVNEQPFDVALSGTGVSANVALYYLVDFEPPFNARPSSVPGSTLPIRFGITNEDGVVIPDDEARSLAADCRVRLRFSGAPDSHDCASYSSGADRFAALLRIPADLEGGTYTLTAEVLDNGNVLGSFTADIVVRVPGT